MSDQPGINSPGAELSGADLPATLSSVEIQKILPHRYPFLLIDKIVEIEWGKRAVGIKNVTANEPYFVGHFPGFPVMPGVLMIEAIAQVGAVAVLGMPQNKGKLAFFAGVDNVRFKRQVVPGDTLKIEVSLSRVRGSYGQGTGEATVDGELACKGEFMFFLGKMDASS
ncbi:MAG: 3-hydroxyacyl-ACP dehydratase FabZ [Chloroflexota bacterium]|nr:3-hydroxyacyl-ACP dehydratase FabZ [Chloroflexota bacterium]